MSTGLPFSNNNAIMRNIEFELHCVYIFFDQTIAYVYIPIASYIKYYIIFYVGNYYYKVYVRIESLVCGIAGTFHFI